MLNRLADATSPYLLQHKHNPVDWYEWSRIPFELAKKLDKPIFLSIGYSSCHWCHVMAHESFEDTEIASLLNKYFISIKVDREERPDIDTLYMTATQIMTGSGGWPMSVFIDTEGRPFFCGTYFPPQDRFGRKGFSTILNEIVKMWNNSRSDLLENGKIITEKLKSSNLGTLDIEIDESILNRAFEKLGNNYDKEEGGFGSRPKFPSLHNLIFLTRMEAFYKSTGAPGKSSEAQSMTINTLRKMALGGITDQIGGGIHRYSTDRYWLVPHFEKMLYDQSMHLWALAEVSNLSADEIESSFLKIIADETTNYMDSVLRDQYGAYYSAEDADTSEGEGEYYLWSLEEIHGLEKSMVAAANSEIAIPLERLFNLTEEGNYLDEATQQTTGKNIINLFAWGGQRHPITEIANYRQIQRVLLETRNTREKPLLDDKILSDWNGLAAISFVRQYCTSGQDQFLHKAKQIIEFLLDKMTAKDKLIHSSRNGRSSNAIAFLDDYAYVSSACIQIFISTGQPQYLIKAIELVDKAEEMFASEDGTYYHAEENNLLPVRPSGAFDSAMPSGISIMYGNLLYLGHIMANGQYFTRAQRIINSLASNISQYPQGYTMLLSYFAEEIIGRKIYLLEQIPEKNIKDYVIRLNKANRVGPIIIIRDATNNEKLKEKMAWLPDLKNDSLPRLYKCKGFSCGLPITGHKEIEAYINQI